MCVLELQKYTVVSLFSFPFCALLKPYKMQPVEQVSVGGRPGSAWISFFFFAEQLSNKSSLGKYVSVLAMHSTHAKERGFSSLLTSNPVFTCWLSGIN